MRLLFFKAAKGSWADKWNAWRSKGKFSRVQIQFVDGTRFGVDVWRGRATFNPLPFTPENWEAVEMEGAEDVIRASCKAYDGLWLPWWTWFFPWYRAILARRFGAVLAAQAFVDANYTDVPSEINASSFHVWVTNWISNNPIPPAPPFPPKPPVPVPTPTPTPVPPQPPIPTPTPPVPPYRGMWGKRRYVEVLTWE